jgi:hypothetical protein
MTKTGYRRLAMLLARRDPSSGHCGSSKNLTGELYRSRAAYLTADLWNT